MSDYNDKQFMRLVSNIGCIVGLIIIIITIILIIAGGNIWE